MSLTFSHSSGLGAQGQSASIFARVRVESEVGEEQQELRDVVSDILPRHSRDPGRRVAEGQVAHRVADAAVAHEAMVDRKAPQTRVPLPCLPTSALRHTAQGKSRARGITRTGFALGLRMLWVVLAGLREGKHRCVRTGPQLQPKELPPHVHPAAP